VLDEWLSMPGWGQLPVGELCDLGYRYLTASTVDAGIVRLVCFDRRGGLIGR